MQPSVKTQYQVFEIKSSYDDLELHERRETTEYVLDEIGLRDYFRDLADEYHILDVHNHPQARMNEKFVIRRKFISNKKYVELKKI